MKFNHRLTKLEQQKTLNDERRWQKAQDYFARAVPALATKLGVRHDEVTIDVMAANGDKLAQLLVRIRKRIEGNSDVSDLV